MYQDMLQYVKNYLEQTNPNATSMGRILGFRNRYDHTLRVWEWTKRINAVEQGDGEALDVAAIFHDVGKGVNSELPHAQTSAQICRHYLQNAGWKSDKIECVAGIIATHSSKKAEASQLTLEQRILIDADLLDEAGALSILWDAMDTGTQSDASYAAVYRRVRHHVKEREQEIAKTKTGEGKRLLTQRIHFVQQFLHNMELEMNIPHKEL